MSAEFEELKNRPSIAPWEPKGQVRPDELPDKAPDKYPSPWREVNRGNGHIDLVDANGVYLAHIYVWDEKEDEILRAKLRSINGEQGGQEDG